MVLEADRCVPISKQDLPEIKGGAWPVLLIIIYKETVPFDTGRMEDVIVGGFNG
jgi:hypothetical protein